MANMEHNGTIRIIADPKGATNQRTYHVTRHMNRCILQQRSHHVNGHVNRCTIHPTNVPWQHRLKFMSCHGYLLVLRLQANGTRQLWSPSAAMCLPINRLEEPG